MWLMVKSFIFLIHHPRLTFVSSAFLGDTLHHTHSPMPPLESFKPLKSTLLRFILKRFFELTIAIVRSGMVFAGIYPLENGGFLKLEESVRRVSKIYPTPHDRRKLYPDQSLRYSSR